jgi:hypothetical protein
MTVTHLASSGTQDKWRLCPTTDKTATVTPTTAEFIRGARDGQSGNKMAGVFTAWYETDLQIYREFTLALKNLTPSLTPRPELLKNFPPVLFGLRKVDI